MKLISKKTINIFFCFMLVTQLTFAKKISTKNTSKMQNIELSENQAYKMLYDNQVKANDAILQTVLYALGGLGSAMLLVFASNWWFNDKKVKDIIKEIDMKVKDLNKDVLAELTEKINSFSNEKTTEINEFKSKLQEDLTNNSKELTLKFTNFTESLRNEIKNDDKELITNFQHQLDSFNDNYRQQILTLNENINLQINSIKEIINTKEETLKSLIENQKRFTVSELSKLKSEHYRSEYYLWDTRGVHINALKALFDELDTNIGRGFIDVDFYLDQIEKTLSKISKMRQSDKDVFYSILSKSPEKNTLQAEKIKQIITDLEVQDE